MSGSIYYYNPKKYGRVERAPSTSWKVFKTFFFLIATTTTIFALTIAVHGMMAEPSQGTIVSPLPEKQNNGIVAGVADIVDKIKEPFTKQSEELGEVVTKSLEGTKGTYAVAIKNLKTGEEYYQNENIKFDSASLYKLWVLGTVYEQVDEGTLTMDKSIGSDVKTLNAKFDIDPEFAELTEGSVNFTVQSAVEQMITISHNYAALLLHSTVRTTRVSKFLDTYGLSHSNTGSPPQTTAYDTMRYYEQLYNGVLVSPSASPQMMDVLKRQKLNDRIPKYLPDNIKVAHKTGELGGVKHDAGIVFAPSGDYIFVVLSKSDSPQGAAERIALLSKDVYDYFEK